MILTRNEMLAVEQAAFQTGETSAELLMDEVGRRMANCIRHLAPGGGRPGLAVLFLGKGNNAGDALVAASHLRAAGWELILRLARSRDLLGELAGRKMDQLLAAGKAAVLGARELADALRVRNSWADGPLITIDGLLGVGAKGPLRAPIKDASREMNALRTTYGAWSFALDLPTGLDADGAAPPDPDTVVADVTLTVGYAKQGLVADDAVNHVGHLEVISLAALATVAGQTLEERPRPQLSVRENLATLLLLRPFESNKTTYGRVGVVAGSVGTTGAAAMCALGALRAGAGLVTLLVHEKIYPTAAVTARPEVMVKPIGAFAEVLDEKLDVVAIGPGLSPHEDGNGIRRLIEKWPCKMVVDAGAITALAQDPAALGRAAGPRLLTPHPGEMARLWKADAHVSRGTDIKKTPRRTIVENFTAVHEAALLLKGARTTVGQRASGLAYNSTGNPGMATGGMGDVLTGVCAAMLGQGLEPWDAGRFGAFLCGRAAELAVRAGGESEQSLLAADLPSFFGRVFAELRGTVF